MSRSEAAPAGRPRSPRAGELSRRWVGVALSLTGVVAILALAATGRLTLYVNPRYVVFTVVLALVGGVVAVAAIVVGPGGDGHDHDHHDHVQLARDASPEARPGPARTRWRLGTVLRLLAVAVALVALLVVPPSSLSGSLRQDRSLDTSGSAPDLGPAKSLTGSDPSTFSVKDWSILLQRDPQSLLGKTVHVSGYVIDEHSDDEVWVGRLLITCCAVDARPVGVPVAMSGWRSRFQPNDWVDLTGTFVTNTDAGSVQPVVVKVTTMVKTAEPAQQYVY